MTKNRIVFFALGLAALNLHAADIRHRFLAMDESRSQLHYVDQFDSSKDWTLKLPGGCRDVQLLGNQRVLISTPDGYAEYDLRIRKKVKMLADSKYGNTETAVRLPNGHTSSAAMSGRTVAPESS